MDNSSEHEAAESDMDHRVRDAYPLLVIANEPFPAGHPYENASRTQTPWQYFEARFLVGMTDDLEDEVVIGRGIHKATDAAHAVSSIRAGGKMISLARLAAIAPKI
ncbi:hypothetical protein ACFSLT_17480 [Novosphingobium resinovorum]|jgi:hypothetical protein